MRENHKFQYWYIEMEPAVSDDIIDIFPWLFDSFAVTSDITLHAKWISTLYELQVFSYNENVDLSNIEFIFETYDGEFFSKKTDANGYLSFVTNSGVYYPDVVDSTVPSGFEIDVYREGSNTFYAELYCVGNPGIDGPPEIGTGDDDEGEWWTKIKYDETDLLFKMTNCSNSQELSSGCAQYLAGEYNDANIDDPINELINERNRNAYALTKVNVTYDYFDDVRELYGFANARNAIYDEIMAATSATPDIYCNWMTDLLICSLKGCFANLYSRNYGEGDYRYNNHFNLKNDGYMADLMGSLTLSTQKIYVVASDYFIDIIRSFYVIPVNVSLFNQIAPSMYPGVVNPTIDTFFDEVKPCDCTNYDSSGRCTDECADGGWTYDRLMQFSQQIYQSAGTYNPETIHDRLGFALGANGLPAAGLIYSSSVNIINKEWNPATNKYDYSYPATNEKLYAIVDKISELMGTQGVYYATAADAAQLTYEGEKTALLGIRNQFVSDKMLFGGIVTLGSLEYQAYQNMKTPTRGGFGVVPVPVYEAGDNYLTQIHTVGRAGAIRYSTSKFVQCSAFLHYQSSNSKDILNEYFESTFTAADGDYMNGNIDMLRFIRANARTAFDKLFEDAIGFLYEDVIPNSAGNRFHTLLADNGYQYDVSDKYEELYGIRSEILQNLENEYSKLPS